ncbi:MAG: NFACT RNA binding domain-containing protein [Acidobacteriota bacterium]|jgi:predicted ribosome quality control (RQC) complex YloA/Tae2 family protein|nr:NFACT RNA binding domain-containing protein [Acidobacteriota bacterium]
MLSLKELKRAVRAAAPLITGARLKRIDQPEPCGLILTFDTKSDKIPLLFTCRPGYARFCLAQAAESSASDGSFYQYLRANWAGCRVAGFDAAENDRQAVLRLESGTSKCEIVFSIMGARSNIYLLDAGGGLVHSLRPLEETRNELAVGEPWTPPRDAAVSEGIDRWEAVADSAYLNEIAETCRALERRGDAEDLARRVRQALKKENAFLDRKRAGLLEDLRKAQQAQADLRRGELLKNVLHTVRRGDDRVQAVDYETGETVEIPLDARLSPAANLERYFSRYHKEQRGERRISELLTELDSVRRELEEIDERVKTALLADVPDTAALWEIAELPLVRRNLKRQPVGGQKKTPPGNPPPHAVGKAGKDDLPSRLRPKRYLTEEGLEIWVGRNDEGNDYLTTRLARGNDLFFHLEGYPGSHVVLRTQGRTDPSPKSVLDACELAVHFSKMKNAGSADVHVAPIKDVKKPRGAKAGLVYVRGGKSIRLKRIPDRLEKILASRVHEDS